MPFSFKKRLAGSSEAPKEVSIYEFFSVFQEFQCRRLALEVCINMIANAVGKCEFKTFFRGKEVRGAEYYLWNVEPNINQSSSEFLHKLICRLYLDNEALVIATEQTSCAEMLAVADSFVPGPQHPEKENVYSDITVGDFTYAKTFAESEVIHIRLNERSVTRALNALYDCFERLAASAIKAYTWGSGIHLKAKINQIAEGDDGYAANFKKLLDETIRPWVEQDNGVLPEFENYSYDAMYQSRQAPDSKDVRSLFADIFSFTARCLHIPPVLIMGDVADTQDAVQRWLTTCIDPLCYNLEENINRKRYGYLDWREGSYLQIDTTNIQHFDLFVNAANVEKLIGSGCFSINRVLEAAGMPKINQPWADQHWLTLNIGAVEAAAKAAENLEKGGSNG